MLFSLVFHWVDACISFYGSLFSSSVFGDGINFSVETAFTASHNLVYKKF